MSKDLEPGDISIHVAIAYFFVIIIAALAWWFLDMVWPMYPAAVFAVCAFMFREGKQQMKKNSPPEAWWKVWQWGKNGLVEGLCSIPATALAVGTVLLLRHLWG